MATTSTIPARTGSPMVAAELALCRSRAGIVDLSEAAVSELGGAPDELALALALGDYRVIGLLGPRAEALLRDAVPELPAALPAGTLATAGRPPVLVLREAPERYLVLVARDRAAALWDELLRVGRAHGAAPVGRAAANLLRARDALPGCR